MNFARTINIMRTEGTYKSKIPVFLWLICEREEKRENSDLSVLLRSETESCEDYICADVGALTKDTHRYL